MNIFISQTSGKSRDVARALQEWLIKDMQLGKPWMSTNIPGGDDWRMAIKTALGKAGFGILCMTADNLANQWIIYEVGALDFNGVKVFPYVIDTRFRYLPEPINHLQGGRANEEGTKSLVIEINKALPKSIPEGEIIERFDSKWNKLKEKLESIHRNRNYEKAIDNFIKLILVTNEFRKFLDYYSLIDEALGTQKYDRKKSVDNIFKMIEKQREDFIKKYRFTKIDPELTRKARHFFKKNFKPDDLHKIIVRLEPILLSDAGDDKKRKKLLSRIKIEELEVFLRFHRLLAEALENLVK